MTSIPSRPAPLADRVKYGRIFSRRKDLRAQTSMHGINDDGHRGTVILVIQKRDNRATTPNRLPALGLRRAFRQTAIK
jgi:hypothetical protein